VAIDETTAYVPVNNLRSVIESPGVLVLETPTNGTGEMVALDLASGRVLWDRKLPSSEFGGATVTNDLVFTTTFDGTLWALDKHTGAIVWRAQLPAGSIAPVAIVGDSVLAAAGSPLTDGQRTQLVAYRLGG
jgi:outer membrane protein assembly factor BamB